MTDSDNTSRDPVLLEVGEASMRLMAGVVPPSTLQRLNAEVAASPGAYPWREVTAEILAQPVEDVELLQKALRGQRDWVMRGGVQRQRPRKSLQTRGKTLLAFVLVRSLFFVLYTAAVIALLILLKHKWPAVDIYAVLDWLREAVPGFFGGSGS